MAGNKYVFPKEREKLLKIYKQDQGIRANGDFSKVETELRMTAIDLENQKDLLSILDKIKLPTIKNIGIDGCEAVWIVAQHAVYDLKLMKKILKLMQEVDALNRNGGYRKGIPYLVDRINIMEGKNQLFGTQFWNNPSGTITPYPIDNSNHLEQRRKDFGIRPFSEYRKDVVKASSGKKRDIYHILY